MNCHVGGSVSILWSAIWKSSLHERKKVFLWHVLVDALPTKDKLCQRITAIEDLCVVCKECLESTFHLFKSCPGIKALAFFSRWGEELMNAWFLMWLSSLSFVSIICQMSVGETWTRQISSLSWFLCFTIFENFGTTACLKASCLCWWLEAGWNYRCKKMHKPFTTTQPSRPEDKRSVDSP